MIVPEVSRRGEPETFQFLDEIGTCHRFLVSANAADMSTPVPFGVQTSGTWLTVTKPGFRNAAIAPVRITGPSSIGVTHQSVALSWNALGSRLPRNKIWLLSGAQIG